MNRPVKGGFGAGPGAKPWFIEAAGRVWGPYPDKRMASFVAEGRVARETLVGAGPEGPFAPAARQERLRVLFGDPEPEGVAEASLEALEPRPAQPRPEPPAERAADPAPEAGAARPLLVWAILASQRVEVFEAALGGFGAFARVQPGLWLIRARMGPAPLRNALTRRLQAGDSLMVVHAPLDQAAWFNLAPDADRALRQMWMG